MYRFMKKKQHSGGRYCIASGCHNCSLKTPGLHLFSLPKAIVRRRKWLRLIGREDLLDKTDLKFKHYEVCSAHFNDSEMKIMKMLSKTAVPSKFLYKHSQKGISPTSSEISDVSSQTGSSSCILSDITINEPTNISNRIQTEIPTSAKKTIETSKAVNDKTRPKRKLSEDLHNSDKSRRLETEYHKIEKELEGNNAPITSDLEDDINLRFQKLIDWENKSNSKFKDNRCDAEYKIIPHSNAYESFLQTVLKLPNKGTINRFKLNIPPKLDDRVLKGLTMKIKSLPQQAKYCTICVDEIVLNPRLYYIIKTDEVVGFHDINGVKSPDIARNAYVIMLQGMYCNWKQPIAYAFLASTNHFVELDTWVNEVIRKLFEVGIDVRAIISDQESNFDKYAKEIKKVTVDIPYFFVDGRKIYYIFDVPHLLTSVRNDLLASNFYHEGMEISWNHIIALYEDQKQKNLRLIPKITDSHVKPNSFQSMEVKYAAQIFSSTVYAALETYIDFGQISEGARATAKFIKTMDDLFNVLNSNKLKAVKKSKTAFRMSEHQKTILEDAQDLFANMKSINHNTGEDNTNHRNTFVNFQVSIQSVLRLFEDLKSEGFQYLMTRRLNQDSLKNFFGSIRQLGGSCTVPTPIQFTRAFSKLFLVNMLKKSLSNSANCESDLNEILLKADDLMNTKSLIPGEGARTSLVALGGDTSYRIDIPEQNALTYVASYLIFKCSKKHKCNDMVKALKSMPGLDKTKMFANYESCYKKASFYGSLKIPPQEFNQYVEKLENVFTNNFEKSIRNRPGSTIFEFLKEIPPIKLCPCFPTDYLLKLFVRLRVFTTLKCNNRCFKAGK